MTLLALIIGFALLAIVVVQIGRINEFSKALRGEEEVNVRDFNKQGLGLFIFGIVFLIITFASAYMLRNYMLGYGPHKAASAHGGSLDNLFNMTLIITGIVFVLTQFALFYFSYKYRYNPNRKAEFYAHNDTLEYIWTAVPAVAMTFLVVSGLIVWNDVMADIEPNEDHLEIEATGYQFAWAIRYPGPDGKLGGKDFRLIDGVNILGQDWMDAKNLDDVHAADRIVLPKGKKVRVRITARDVLHNFYLPHFRVKMDAVPGMPTYFVFTPMKTTEEYREELSKYPEYNVPANADEPDGPLKWEAFNYELACAELCGKGHYSMKRIVEVVEPYEYERWLAEQPSFYLTTIRGTDGDPLVGQLLDVEIEQRKQEFDEAFSTALEGTTREEKTIRLQYVNFETGSNTLTADSRYELENVAQAMESNVAIVLELAGHTDNTGNAADNLSLSQARANAVRDFLVDQGVEENRILARGYGQTQPIDSNDSEEGRANNRRTEIIITQQ